MIILPCQRNLQPIQFLRVHFHGFWGKVIIFRGMTILPSQEYHSGSKSIIRSRELPATTKASHPAFYPLLSPFPTGIDHLDHSGAASVLLSRQSFVTLNE